MNYQCHKSSYIDDGVKIGDNTIIWYFCHIQSGAKIGKNCMLAQNVNVGPGAIIGDNVRVQNNSHIYEGVTLEDDVFIGPSVVFTNIINPRSFINRGNCYFKTLVKKGATLGANTTIVCGITIGEYSIVGAGAVVTKDVPPYSLVYGNPAKVMKQVDRNLSEWVE